MESILTELAGWIRQHPLAFVLSSLAVPLVLALTLEHLARRRRVEPPRAPEPPAEAGPPARPEARPAEPAPAPERLPEPAPEPALEPVPESAAEPETEPAPVPEPMPEAVPAPVAEAAPAPVPESAPVPEPIPEPEPVSTVEPVPAPEPAPIELPRVRLRDRLRSTSEALVGRLSRVLGGRRLDDELLEELEEVLFTADLGVSTAESLLERVRADARGEDGEAVRALLKSAIAEKLSAAERSEDVFALQGTPHVVLILGVNGAGKTTTIGKLAARHQARDRKVILGAGDTFRAAAIEQLQAWGERVGCEVIAGAPGGDPASVAFDTVKSAIARRADVALIDTAGRLQTKKPLMEELGKIVRVIGRELPDAPHEILLVLDANTGQNAISQARLFTEVADVTGLVLTKMDGTAKGGVIVGLADEFGIPVNFVGVGEGIEDLREFDATEFVDALFGDEA